MADKIRLGFVGSQRQLHLVQPVALPRDPGQPRCRDDCRLHHPARERRGSPPAVSAPSSPSTISTPWWQSDEIDAVAVVVRVPSHYEPTKAAIEAGKHVLTEWPLGRNTAEAVELADLARSRGVQTAVGLQSRVSPALLHVKDLIDTGYVGEVLSCSVNTFRDGPLERPSDRTWQRDASLGAHTLTIATGHVIDALRFVAGDFARVACMVSTQVPQWYEPDTEQFVDTDSPDNVRVSGQLERGAAAAVHVGAAPWAGSGYRMEIYGREGTLIVTGKRLVPAGRDAARSGRTAKPPVGGPGPAR